MAIVLILIGYGWAILGIANLVGVFSEGGSAEQGWGSLALMVNVGLFILPGLIAGTMGSKMYFKDDEPLPEGKREARRVVLEGGPRDGTVVSVSLSVQGLKYADAEYADSGRLDESGRPIWVAMVTESK